MLRKFHMMSVRAPSGAEPKRGNLLASVNCSLAMINLLTFCGIGLGVESSLLNHAIIPAWN